MERVIVCAANRYEYLGQKIIIPSARHYDPLMRDLVMRLGLSRACEEEQGFIDQRGVFLTREEALPIARAAEQIRRRCGGDTRWLFSENLY